MARAKSSILTVADKKAVLADLKTKITATKATLKTTSAIFAARAKEIRTADIGISNATARMADAKKLLADSKAARAAAVAHTKTSEKLLISDTKILGKLERDLAAITQAPTAPKTTTPPARASATTSRPQLVKPAAQGELLAA